MTVDPRFTYARAAAGYDDEFEGELTREILTAITKVSRVADADCLCIRTGEIIVALITNLAGMLALTPYAVRAPTTLRKTVDEIAKHLRRKAAEAAADPETRAFRDRCFGPDVGGHA
jgi:hypothetical protein